MGKSCLPDNLKDANHWDWPWPFSIVPRSWTAFCLGHEAPVKLVGNQKSTKSFQKYEPGKETGPAPIGERGSWQVSWPPYVAFRLRNGWHFRVGMRWDDSDGYYEPSIALRKYSDDPFQDTGTK